MSIIYAISYHFFLFSFFFMFCGLTCSCLCVPSLSRGSFLFHPVRSFTDSSKKYNKCAWSRSLGVFPPRRTFRRLLSDVVFRSPEGRPSPTSPIPEKEHPSAMVPHVAALRTELLHIPEKKTTGGTFFLKAKDKKRRRRIRGPSSFSVSLRRLPAQGHQRP